MLLRAVQERLDVSAAEGSALAKNIAGLKSTIDIQIERSRRAEATADTTARDLQLGRSAQSAEMTAALDHVASLFARLAERIEADRLDRHTLSEVVGQLARQLEAVDTNRPSAVGDSVLVPPRVETRRLGADHVADEEPEMSFDVGVAVCCRFGDQWIDGVEIVEILGDTAKPMYRLRRALDGYELPPLFCARDLRLAQPDRRQRLRAQDREPEIENRTAGRDVLILNPLRRDLSDRAKELLMHRFSLRARVLAGSPLPLWSFPLGSRRLQPTSPSRRRRERPRSVVTLPPDLGVLDAVWHVRRAIDELPAEEATIVRLQHLDGMTQTEIAEKLGIALGNRKIEIAPRPPKARRAAGPSPEPLRMTDRPTNEEREALIAGDRAGALGPDEGNRSRLMADLLADPSTWVEPDAGLEDAVVRAVVGGEPDVTVEVTGDRLCSPPRGVAAAAIRVVGTRVGRSDRDRDRSGSSDPRWHGYRLQEPAQCDGAGSRLPCVS